MDRIRFVQYKGKTILLEDFSNLQPGQEFLLVIATAQALIAHQPPGSVLAVLDATGARYDAEILSAMKKFVQANTPYIRNSAVVGVSGLLNVALNALSRVSGRTFHNFSNREEAMDYLVTS